MTGTTHKTAPAGTVPCYLCHRYREPDKLTAHRCSDRHSCRRAAARMLGLPPQLSKRDRAKLGMA